MSVPEMMPKNLIGLGFSFKSNPNMCPPCIRHTKGRAPKDRINKRILQTMVLVSPYIGLLKTQNVRPVCICGLLGPSEPAKSQHKRSLN